MSPLREQWFPRALTPLSKDLTYPEGFSFPSRSLSAARKTLLSFKYAASSSADISIWEPQDTSVLPPDLRGMSNHLTSESDIVSCKVCAQGLCNWVTNMQNNISSYRKCLKWSVRLFSHPSLGACESKQYLTNGCYLSSLGLLDPSTPHICHVNMNWSQHPLVPGLPKTTLSRSSHPSSCFYSSQFLYWLQPSKPHSILCCSPAGGLCSFCYSWFSSEVL